MIMNIGMTRHPAGSQGSTSAISPRKISPGKFLTFKWKVVKSEAIYTMCPKTGKPEVFFAITLRTVLQTFIKFGR